MSDIGKRISGFFGRLIVFSAFSAWFVFVIWGMKTWGDTNAFVSEKNTIILLALPVIVGMFILFIVVLFIGAITSKREQKKKEEKVIRIGSKEGEKIEINVPQDMDWLPKEFREGIAKFVAEAGKEVQLKSSDGTDKIPKEVKDFFKKFMEKKE